MQYFRVRDLMINVVDERLGKGSSSLCMQDQPTQLNCGIASPVMHAVKWSPRFDLLRRGVDNAVAEKALPAEVDALRQAAEDMGARFAGVIVTDGRAKPNPDCNGSSSLPSPITPWGRYQSELQMSELPAIRAGLNHALELVDKLEKSLEPQGKERKALAEKLTAAAESLKR